ncbi:hypothetical protein [Candidatus Uabimicrobium sp. HlEnr_7]
MEIKTSIERLLDAISEMVPEGDHALVAKIASIMIESGKVKVALQPVKI